MATDQIRREIEAEAARVQEEQRRRREERLVEIEGAQFQREQSPIDQRAIEIEAEAHQFQSGAVPTAEPQLSRRLAPEAPTLLERDPRIRFQQSFASPEEQVALERQQLVAENIQRRQQETISPLDVEAPLASFIPTQIELGDDRPFLQRFFSMAPAERERLGEVSDITQRFLTGERSARGATSELTEIQRQRPLQAQITSELIGGLSNLVPGIGFFPDATRGARALPPLRRFGTEAVEQGVTTPRPIRPRLEFPSVNPDVARSLPREQVSQTASRIAPTGRAFTREGRQNLPTMRALVSATKRQEDVAPLARSVVPAVNEPRVIFRDNPVNSAEAIQSISTPVRRALPPPRPRPRQLALPPGRRVVETADELMPFTPDVEIVAFGEDGLVKRLAMPDIPETRRFVNEAAQSGDAVILPFDPTPEDVTEGVRALRFARQSASGIVDPSIPGSTVRPPVGGQQFSDIADAETRRLGATIDERFGIQTDIEDLPGEFGDLPVKETFGESPLRLTSEAVEDLKLQLQSAIDELPGAPFAGQPRRTIQEIQARQIPLAQAPQPGAFVQQPGDVLALRPPEQQLLPEVPGAPFPERTPPGFGEAFQRRLDVLGTEGPVIGRRTAPTPGQFIDQPDDVLALRDPTRTLFPELPPDGFPLNNATRNRVRNEFGEGLRVRQQIIQSEGNLVNKRLKAQGISGGGQVPPGGGAQGGLIPESDLPPIKNTLWENIVEGLNLPRATLATGDLSAYLRQGGILLAGHPVRGGRSIARVLKRSFSDEAFDALVAQQKQTVAFQQLVEPGFMTYTEVGGRLARREELFVNRFLNRVPIVGGVFRFSERNYTGFLNELRLAVADDVLRGWRRSGNPITREELQALGRFLDHATGRGTGKFLDDYGPALSSTFFAPRLAVSRPQVAWDLALALSPVSSRSFRVRSLIAKDIAAFVGVNSGILMMLAAVPGVDVGVNPRASDFGRVRVGRIEYDFWGGYQQLARAVTQIWGRSRASRSGREIPQHPGQTVARFLRSKLAPTTGLGIDLLPLAPGVPGEPTDFLGRPLPSDPLGIGEQVFQRLMPLVVQDIWDAGRQEGWTGAAKGTPAFFGVTVNAFATFDEQVQDLATEAGISDRIWPHEYEEFAEQIRQESGMPLGGYGLRVEQLYNEQAADYRRLVPLIRSRGQTDVLARLPGRLRGALGSEFGIRGGNPNQEIIQSYFSINTFYAGRRSEAGFAEFGEQTLPDEAGDKFERALQQYHQIGSNFTTRAAYRAAIDAAKAQWRREGTYDYVMASTNRRPELIPPELMAILPDTTRANIQESIRARERRARQRTRR